MPSTEASMSFNGVRSEADATRAAVARALQSRRNKPISTWLVLLAATLLSLLLGLVAALGFVPLFAVVSLVGAIVLVAFPMVGLWAVAVLALVVSGLIELYLPGLQQIRWVPVLMAVLLAGSSLVGHVASQRRRQGLGASVADPSIIVPLAALFLAFSCLSALLSGHGVLGAISGLKGYFQVWGLWVALVLSRASLQQVARFVWWLLPLALVQWPVVLHQYLVLVPIRRAMEASVRGLVAIDVVSGTFGGLMVGGGRSPLLAVLAMVGLTLAVMCYRTGRVRSLLVTWLLVLLCVGPLAFSEVKVIFVFLPITLLVLFGSMALRRPIAFVAGAMVAGLALAGALVLYSGMFEVKSHAPTRWQAYIDSSVGYNIGDDGYGAAGLNRLTVYQFWWKEHDKVDGLARTLFGYGPGVTNANSVAGSVSLAAGQYAGYAPGLTGLSTLLWEVGVVGTALFLAFLLALYRAAVRLCADPALIGIQPELSAARVLVLLLGVGLLHNNLLLIDLADQTLLALATSLVVVAGRSASSGLGGSAGLHGRVPFGIRPLHLPAGVRL